MLSLILCCAALFTVSNALPGGAPAQACDNLTPGNPPHGVVEQAPPNPWIVDITGFDAVENSTTFTYNPGQTYTGEALRHWLAIKLQQTFESSNALSYRLHAWINLQKIS